MQLGDFSLKEGIEVPVEGIPSRTPICEFIKWTSVISLFDNEIQLVHRQLALLVPLGQNAIQSSDLLLVQTLDSEVSSEIMTLKSSG